MYKPMFSPIAALAMVGNMFGSAIATPAVSKTPRIYAGSCMRKGHSWDNWHNGKVVRRKLKGYMRDHQRRR